MRPVAVRSLRLLRSYRSGSSQRRVCPCQPDTKQQKSSDGPVALSGVEGTLQPHEDMTPRVRVHVAKLRFVSSTFDFGSAVRPQAPWCKEVSIVHSSTAALVMQFQLRSAALNPENTILYLLESDIR